ASGNEQATPEVLPPAVGWLTPGVRGIGFASLLSDMGHEIPTALLPSLITVTLGAPAAALGLIEGIADGLSGLAKLVGGWIADDPGRRRSVALGGYTVTAILSSATGLAGSIWQVGILRAGAWTARGIRGPARNALLADAVDVSVYGRAYGFERAMDNLGAVAGPALAIVLVGLVGVRVAILFSIIPGLLAAVAIAYAIRHLQAEVPRKAKPITIQVRPVLHGPLGRLFVGIGAFELGNVAATLLILRATQLLTPSDGSTTAAQVAIGLYVAYNLAATLSSVPAGRAGDAIGYPRVLILGIVLFALAYAIFAVAGPSVLVLGLGFILAGIGIGCAETAENATVASLAPNEIRGSAFGLLAATQSLGDVVASGAAGILWTLVGPAAAFGYATLMMLIAVPAIILRRSA
ncbi:MAG: MFS transporter, partial [Candidatus Limnocylindrales bacterium]